MRDILRDSNPIGHIHIPNFLPLIGRRLATPFGRVLSIRQQIRIVIRIELLITVPQGHLTQQHDTGVVLLVGETVVGGFADHVGEIDPLAEHVTRDGGLGWGDSQALAQDTHVVC